MAELFAARIQDGMTVVDIGAHLGLHVARGAARRTRRARAGARAASAELRLCLSPAQHRSKSPRCCGDRPIGRLVGSVRRGRAAGRSAAVGLHEPREQSDGGPRYSDRRGPNGFARRTRRGSVRGRGQDRRGRGRAAGAGRAGLGASAQPRRRPIARAASVRSERSSRTAARSSRLPARCAADASTCCANPKPERRVVTPVPAAPAPRSGPVGAPARAAVPAWPRPAGFRSVCVRRTDRSTALLS